METIYNGRKSHTDIYYLSLKLTLDDCSEKNGKKKKEYTNNRKH